MKDFAKEIADFLNSRKWLYSKINSMKKNWKLKISFAIKKKDQSQHNKKNSDCDAYCHRADFAGRFDLIGLYFTIVTDNKIDSVNFQKKNQLTKIINKINLKMIQNKQ